MSYSERAERQLTDIYEASFLGTLVFIYSFLTWKASLCKFTHQDPVGGESEPPAMDHF